MLNFEYFPSAVAFGAEQIGPMAHCDERGFIARARVVVRGRAVINTYHFPIGFFFSFIYINIDRDAGKDPGSRGSRTRTCSGTFREESTRTSRTLRPRSSRRKNQPSTQFFFFLSNLQLILFSRRYQRGYFLDASLTAAPDDGVITKIVCG